MDFKYKKQTLAILKDFGYSKRQRLRHTNGRAPAVHEIFLVRSVLTRR
jgi:hypothetical protein